jgi:hypothetical protein
LQALVTADLARCSLSVHPLGAHFGLIPERAEGRSIQQLQLDWASLAAAPAPRRLARVIWIPEALAAAEPAQAEFIEQVRRTYPMLGFELLEATLQKLETHLRDRLEAPTPLERRATTGESVRVYVMCDAGDRDAARAVRKGLLASGLEVDFPPESGEPGEVRELHHERLREDDAFVIFYGRTPDVWVQRQLGDLRKAAGLGRRGPIVARRVFLAEPATADKEDLLADASLALNGLSADRLEEALRPLLADLEAHRTRRVLDAATGTAS